MAINYPNQVQKKRLSATISYLLSAIVFAILGFVFLGLDMPALAERITMSPLTLATIHTIILGFMLTVAYGVSYQVIPIAFQAPALPRHVLYWHLPAHLLSVCIMIAGFLISDWSIVGIGGTLLLAAFLAYVTVAQISFRKAKNKTPVHRHLVLPMLSLFLVMLFGLWMAFGLPGSSVDTLLTHVTLGAFGFWLGLVMVISYKFIPMFALSHGYKASLPIAIRVYYAGIALVTIADLISIPIHDGLRIAGASLMAIGVTKFAWDSDSILKARKRKKMVLPLRLALFATTCLMVSAIVLTASLAFHLSELVEFFAYFMLVFGFTPLIFSYMQKIVPFLWYEYRFSHHKDRKTAPALDDMIPKDSIYWAIGIYHAGAILGLMTLIFAPILPIGSIISTIGLLAGLLCAAGTLGLSTALYRVLTIGGPRIDD